MSSVNLATRWEDDEDYSPARMDAKTIVRDTAANIVAIASTRQIGLAIPTDTGSGLIKNVAYYVNYNTDFNRISFEPVFYKHLHDSDEDVTGGSFLDIYMANANNAQIVANYDSYMTAMWDINLASGGTFGIDTSLVAQGWHTGTTTGATSHGTIGGIVFEFGDKMSFQWGARCSLASNILTRVGINVDAITQTPDTTIRKFGVEGCDGHGTNWVMINGNGNSGSEHVTATTAPLNPADIEPYAILHDPGTTDTFYFDRVQNAQSSTNIASDGSTSKSRMIRAGIKLPTGTTSKSLYLRYWQLIGNTSGELMGVYI